MSSETQTAGPEIFDSLPYYDNDLAVHPLLKQRVEHEIARESLLPTQALHPHVPPPFTLFSVCYSFLIVPFL